MAHGNWKTAVLIATAVLGVQAAVLHSRSRPEVTPLARDLASFPARLGDWTMAQEGVVEKEIQDVLQADDLLTREYARAGGRANLFIAYFHSQRTGKAPHSPKNCLPGSGWLPSESEIMTIPVTGSEAVEANRYVVSKGSSKSVVLYWYQTHRRTIASEYRAKVYLVADSIRYNRSDTALVRVVTPVRDGDVDGATREAVSLARASYPVIRPYLPE